MRLEKMNCADHQKRARAGVAEPVGSSTIIKFYVALHEELDSKRSSRAIYRCRCAGGMQQGAGMRGAGGVGLASPTPPIPK